MTYKRITSIVLIIATFIAAYLLTIRAINIEYGDPRCSQVTINGSTWEPEGWNIADGYEPLTCSVQGTTLYLWEDGSISPL
jgi:hypothetical protein